MTKQTNPVRFGAHEADADRPVWPAIWKGFKNRCPNCGQGRLFHRWLKVTSNCPNCDEELFHEKSDDLPPYLTIVIVGHIVVTLILIVESRVVWSLTTHLLLWIPITSIMTLAMLQPIKGGVVGLQWALRLFGFGGGEQADKE